MYGTNVPQSMFPGNKDCDVLIIFILFITYVTLNLTFSNTTFCDFIFG
jgi:hypothetical protein